MSFWTASIGSAGPAEVVGERDLGEEDAAAALGDGRLEVAEIAGYLRHVRGAQAHLREAPRRHTHANGLQQAVGVGGVAVPGLEVGADVDPAGLDVVWRPD